VKVTATGLPEVLVLEPRVFSDDRGYFFESYNRNAMVAALGPEAEFVQDNHSRSARGVIRGLHFQVPPRAQGKLVRVTSGRVFDVAVDIRPESPRFGRWTGIELSAANFLQVWIPAGFAHGFLALEDASEVQYKTTDYYAPDLERSLSWCDAAIGIRWPLPEGCSPIVSPKDAAAPGLTAAHWPRN
jgi:dTDP-4-dehydrorhamnose 3,5-epimerase